MPRWSPGVARLPEDFVFFGRKIPRTPKYNLKLEEQKRTAQSIEQQQKYQEQIALQQRIIDQQRSQQAFQDSMNELSDLGKQMQNSGMQMQQYFLNQSPPQVAPLSLPGSNQVNCVNVGSVTNCRY